MHSSSLRRFALLFSFIGLIAFAAGCKKQVAAPPPAPAPAPPPAKPTVTLNASTTSVNAGQSVTLSWSSTNATDLDLEPAVGKVAPEGSTSVSPAQTTTYTITATGPGGTADASVNVTVSVPPPPPPAPKGPSIEELFAQNVKDAFFDFNKSDIRPDAREALTKTAEFFRAHPEIRVTVEGHCDERGSTEYNLGLGQRRAEAARNYLISLGIAGDHMSTVSYGKERPFCTEHGEPCWQMNRRAHFILAQ